MTRKDFELIAGIIRDLRGQRTQIPPWCLNTVALEFAARLRSTNPAFDRDRFLCACGMED